MTASAKQPYKIYRDPIPAPKQRRRLSVPLGQMKVGEVRYPATVLGSPNALAMSARQWTAQNAKDWMFLVCVVGDVIGIWRVR